MTQQPERVLSCDSCDFAEKTNSKTYPVKCMISKPVPMMVHEYCIGWFGYVGCASHSASSQQRIEQAIKMLEQWKRGEMVDLTDNTWYIEIGSHKIDEAITLLRGEQHE